MSNSEASRAVELIRLLTSKVVGQTGAFRQIVPYLEMHEAGLSPDGRPIGVFLLLGPTGTGKTRSVEALAEILHGSHQMYLRVDCGEFQLDHEVARLVGAPPGYLGHRETKPVLSQEALRSVTTPRCDVSLVLFDEIEKAAPSLTTLLLGILDKARLQTGDNASVDFQKTLIFLTSNLGAREMSREMGPTFGFEQGSRREAGELAEKLESIAITAARKRFSPEFINRIDAVLTYQPLSAETLARIVDLQIDELRQHVKTKLGPRSFEIEVSQAAKDFLVSHGTSPEYGARELKRTVYRNLTQPLATRVAQNQVEPGSCVSVEVDPTGEKIELLVNPGAVPARAAQDPQILIVDDNTDLLQFLATVMEGSGWHIITAGSSFEAQQKTRQRPVDVALLDYMLPDQNGLILGIQLKEKMPQLQVLIMTGAHLPAHEEELCKRNGFPLIQKPFLVEEVLEPVRRRLRKGSSGTQTAR